MLFAAPRCEIDRARYNRAVGVLAPAGTTDLIGAAAVAALIGGLAAIERKGALQLMLSRPIVLAPLLGWALGDPRGGLVLGVPLELIFLGGVNLGGSLPDNETLLAAALTSAVVPAGIFAGTGVDAPLAALGLALLYPLAVAGRMGARGGERHPRDPRSARAGVRGHRLWRDDCRGRAAESAAMTGAAQAARDPRRVSPATLLRVLWRSLFLQAAWNPRGMQNLGFAYAMEPALRDLYPDPTVRAHAVERHLEFFNC